MRGPYQTIEAQTAANLLGVHDNDCGPQLLRAREELAHWLGSGAPELVTVEVVLPPHPFGLACGSAWLSPALLIAHVPPMLSLLRRYWLAFERPACCAPQSFEYSCLA